MVDQQTSTDVPAGGILEPIAHAEFFASYWEQQPLHIARSATNPFEKLIDVSAIENLLSTNELFFPTIQLSHAGNSIPTSEYTDDVNKIVGGRVVDRYRRGSTIVITHAHKLQKALMDLCRSVQRSFMMRCQTNVYLSPAGNQGFNPHFDTHDVFILQISGRKTFNFYSGGTHFPTGADRFDRDIHQIGTKTESIELSAGDTLYIPRGFVHDAVANKDEPSLHVTLGVYPILMHELLQEITHISIESDADMRKAVPQSLWTSTDSRTLIAEQLRKVMLEQLSEDSVNLALSRLQDSMALDAKQDSHNSLTMATAQQISLSSELWVNHEAILQLERTGNILKLRTFGAVLEFNEPFSTSIEWLITRPKAVLKDIPGLDNSQRTALIEQLLENAIVQVR